MTYEATEPVTVSAKALRASFKALESQIEEVKVVTDEDGWHIYGMALDHASMVNADIGKEAFEAYTPWSSFAVRTSDILEPIAKAKDTVTLRIDERGLLVITAGRMTYRRGLEPDFEQFPRMPKKEPLDIEFAIPAAALSEIATCVSDKDIKSQGRGLRFTQDADGVTIESYENEDVPQGTVSMRIPRADTVLMDGEGESTYSHRIIREIVAAMPSDADVDVLFGADNVMMLSYSVDHADLVFALAPWLDREGE